MIYLDHNATTPIDSGVLDAMRPYLEDLYGNASGLYRLGRLSRDAIETARNQVALLTGAKPEQVFFTSGATESNHLSILGFAAKNPHALIACSATEHASVLEPIQQLNRFGVATCIVPVDSMGRLDHSKIPQNLGYLALILANNETGVINDLARAAFHCAQVSAFLHIDAVQALGRIAFNFRESQVDALSLSGHKIHGPKGVGALILKDHRNFENPMSRGLQESGVRSGTENVPGIVGLGHAAELLYQAIELRTTRLKDLQSRLEQGLKTLPRKTHIFGQDTLRIPNTTQFSIDGFRGETLVMMLDKKGFAVSSGSACHTGSETPSPVLKAMGVSDDLALGAVRISLGKDNTKDDIDQVLEALTQLCHSSFLTH
jgi:cysteine desulfurase